MRILTGDALNMLQTMETESVHCCVTSPPYYGLRDYNTATWEGGDSECDHIEQATGASKKNTLGFIEGYRETLPQTNAATISGRKQYRSTCRKCGAKRIDEQIGLEETPDAYVDRLTQVFAEVRRVLRNDGTLWLNLGDSYCAGKTGHDGKYGECFNGRDMRGVMSGYCVDKSKLQGYKPKDLLGIPWRVAFALQADGWYLRSDIIWHKPNPMPESVTDRPTKSHEYIFLLSKSARYFYDAAAIREGQSQNSHGGNPLKLRTNRNEEKRASLQNVQSSTLGPVAGDFGRNKRSVWAMTTRSFKDAHFATFPPELPRLCILAGCPQGGTVLDPFSGAGTTGMVALRLGRNYLGIELNPDYVAMSQRRIMDDAPLFNREEEAESWEQRH